MKTKPFNFEAALVGAPVVTRDGRKVHNVRFVRYPVAADIEGKFGKYYESFTLDGREVLSDETVNALSILIFCIVLIISVGRSLTSLNVPKCFQWICKWETS